MSCQVGCGRIPSDRFLGGESQRCEINPIRSHGGVILTDRGNAVVRGSLHHAADKSRDHVVGIHANTSAEGVEGERCEDGDLPSAEGGTNVDEVGWVCVCFWDGIFSRVARSLIFRLGPEADDGPEHRTCPRALAFERVDDAHRLLEQRGAFPRLAARELVVLDDDDADQAELLEVDHAARDALELAIGEWALELDERRPAVDGVQDGGDDVAAEGLLLDVWGSGLCCGGYVIGGG